MTRNQIAAVIDIGDPLNVPGPLGTPGTNAPSLFNKILSSMVGLITIIAFVYFMFTLITGAIGIITAGGDKVKLETSQKRLTTGIIGVIVVIAALFIADLIATLLGIPDFLDPGGVISNLTPGP
jgi:ABC-type phosphate transport system permease subunit